MIGHLVAWETSTNTTANVVAACGAVATLITAIALLIPSLRGLRRDVAQVHTIVNQDRTDARNYTAALIRQLVSHGVEVPVDQSLPPTDGDNTLPTPATPATPQPRHASAPDDQGDQLPLGALTPEEIRETADDQAERFP